MMLLIHKIFDSVSSPAIFVPVSIFLLLGCSSTSPHTTLEVPIDLPEICHDIDFDLNVEMREMCGVKVRNYRAYKNIKKYRVLLRPKGGKIIKQGDKYELRLPKMLSVPLPDKLLGKIHFTEKSRRQYLRSTWEYHEFFPEGSSVRIRIMRIQIPLNDDSEASVCYTILSRPKKFAEVQQGYAKQLEVLDCKAFDRLRPPETE